MAIFELYSERRRREASSENGDVLTYDNLPERFRQQFIYHFDDFLLSGSGRTLKAYEVITETLRRELGVKQLNRVNSIDKEAEFKYFVKEASSMRVIDAIDLAMFYALDWSERRVAGLTKNNFDKCVEYINIRFKQNELGYAFENGEIIRIDSQFIHAEAVKPALVVLGDPAFASADQEFREAHEHWRNGKHAPVLVECLKAFESTMKIIAHERGWALPAKLSASSLVDMCLANDLIPPWYKAHMTGLRGVLEGGIPTPRNKVGGHGAGPGPAEDVPEELVRYVLHMTAATILFLVDAHKARP